MGKAGILSMVAGVDVAGALLLRHSLGLEAEARAMEKAVSDALSQGLRTADIAAGGKAAGTAEAGEMICAQLRR